MSGCKFAWKVKRVLITGGTGMLGTSVVRLLLDRGAEVHIFTRDEQLDHEHCTITAGDISVEDDVMALLRSHEFDVILHLAAQSQDDEGKAKTTFDTNVTGTLNILEAARIYQTSAVTVIASSCAVVGPLHTVAASVGEPSKIRPYAASKLCAELIAQCYAESFSLGPGIVRLGNLYGPSDSNLGRLVPAVISSALRNQVPVMRSDERTRLNFLYVDDASNAILDFAEKISNGDRGCHTLNVNGRKSLSIKEMVNAILTTMDRLDLLPEESHREEFGTGDSRETTDNFCDNLTGLAETPLEEGLRRTIDWYREHRSQRIE